MEQTGRGEVELCKCGCMGPDLGGTFSHWDEDTIEIGPRHRAEKTQHKPVP